MKSFSESYKAAGVDVTAGYKAVELMKSHVARTNIPGVVSGIGGFGGLFPTEFKRHENACFCQRNRRSWYQIENCFSHGQARYHWN